MCQLLGMNCNTPTDIVFSFEGFHRRGGLTDHHADGWGIAFFEDKGCRLFLDDKPSAESPVAHLVRQYPLKSKNVIAHIRKATQGVTRLVNAHPFNREMWGYYWIFAHNGDLKDFHPPRGQYYRPVGDTDSERAFCHILETLRQQWDEMPGLAALASAIAPLAAEIARHGTFNFMLSNGECLMAFCSTKLHYIVRQSPFHTAHLVDEDISVDFSEVTSPDDRVAVIATEPLTDNEVWLSMNPGALIVFREGEPCIQTETALPAIK